RSFLSIPLVIGAGGVLLGVFLLTQALRQDREPLIPFALFKDRNYTLMNWVAATVMIGMLGIFLPFTIYLQSVLGFSALKAGLTLAPATGITMFVAPAAGRLSDRVAGTYILITGLVLFASGMGWAALIASPSSAWYAFLPPFLVAGAGMGCVFPPMTTVAMRDIEPHVAGAASGLLNTNRQVGAVIGTAAVGALLQNRLAAALPSQARQRSVGLPPPIRDKLVAGSPAPPTLARWARAKAPATTPRTASPRHWPDRRHRSIRHRLRTATWTPCARPSSCQSRCSRWRR